MAACCDRGIRHHRNEDATAIAADPEPGSRAVLVVCDGVSTSIDSDVASLAGARAARDLLVASQPGRPRAPRPAARQRWPRRIEQAAAEANAAVIAQDRAGQRATPPSCTFSAAVLEGTTDRTSATSATAGSTGSPTRARGEQPVQLSVDDSVAQARIAMGVPREEAENGPQAHAITKWLGRDSPDFVADDRLARPPRSGLAAGLLRRAVELRLRGRGPAGADRRAAAAPIGADPLPLAGRLVAWANEQGGKDNITVALARH